MLSPGPFVLHNYPKNVELCIVFDRTLLHIFVLQHQHQNSIQPVFGFVPKSREFSRKSIFPSNFKTKISKDFHLFFYRLTVEIRLFQATSIQKRTVQMSRFLIQTVKKIVRLVQATTLECSVVMIIGIPTCETFCSWVNIYCS